MYKRPSKGTYHTQELTQAGDEGRHDGVLISRMPWEATVVVKSSFDKSAFSQVRLSLDRLGQVDPSTLRAALFSGIHTETQAQAF